MWPQVFSELVARLEVLVVGVVHVGDLGASVDTSMASSSPGETTPSSSPSLPFISSRSS